MTPDQETKELIVALQKLLQKCENSIKDNIQYCTDEELEIINYLSAFFDGYNAGKDKSKIKVGSVVSLKSDQIWMTVKEAIVSAKIGSNWGDTDDCWICSWHTDDGLLQEGRFKENMLKLEIEG